MTMPSPAAAPPLLEIRDLAIGVKTRSGSRRLVDGVSLSIAPGETLGLVGESGSGKSLTALAIMRLLAEPPLRVEAGSVIVDGRDLLTLDRQEMRRIRGNRIGMIFQEPMTSLNPVFTIGYQIMEVLRLHRGLSGAEARRETVELLERVGIGAADKRLGSYPHELSGGQRQRVMIAMALACRPSLLIADEPTTALDVTIQAQILELLGRLREEFGMAVLLITHDLGVVAETCDHVAVMYAGRIVETARVAELFGRPRHPYTHGLMRSIPSLDGPRGELPAIDGNVPEASAWHACAFHPRCPRVEPRCRREPPALTSVVSGHRVACWNHVP